MSKTKVILIAAIIIAIAIPCCYAAKNLFGGKTIEYALEQNPDAIPWYEARNHLGEDVTICGVIEDIDSITADGNPTYIEMGDVAPNDRVTGDIWAEGQAKIPNLEEYKGKLVYMEGYLFEYKGIPSIGIKEPSQIRIVK